MINDSKQISPKDKKQNSNNIMIDKTKNNNTENGQKISNQTNNINQNTQKAQNQVMYDDNYANRYGFFDNKNYNSNHEQIDTHLANQRQNSVERKDKLLGNCKDQDGIDNQNQYIKEQKSQKSTQLSHIQVVHSELRQDTYELTSSNQDLELEKTNRKLSKFMASNGLDSNRNLTSSNQFNRMTQNDSIQTNRNYEENVNTGRSKNTENFSSKLEVELKNQNKGKKRQSKRDSLGLSAQEKALIEKMKLNTNQKKKDNSPLRNLIGRQIYEDQLGKTNKSNRDEQNATPQKRFSKIRYSNNSITPIQMANSPGQSDAQRIVQNTPHKKSFILEGNQISEQDKSMKSEIRNLRQRLNSKQQTSQDSESDTSGSDKERSYDKNYVYNGQDEIEEEQNAKGVQGKMYLKVRDLLQQQLDEDGGYQNQEEEENELNQQEEEMIRPEDFIDQITLEEYDKLTQEQEVRTYSQYLKTYRVQKKSALDKLGYLFYKPSVILKIFKFLFLLKCAISDFCYKIIKSNWFENTILLIIIFNSIMLMLDDPTTDVQSSFADWCEQFFLWTYTAEACLKIIAMGFVLPKGAYLRDGWNILDFSIVVSSLLPLVVGSSTVNLRALRSLRILRPLRTISKVKKLKILLKTLFSAIPYLVNSMIILTFFFLIFAIGGLQLFSGLLLRRCIDPLSGIVVDYNQVCGGGYQCDGINICGKTMSNPQFNVTSFDNIFYSFLMVFQIITMEGWTQIMYQLFDAFSMFTVIYFVLLIFIGSFFLINLTLAVIKAKFSDNQGVTVIEQEQEEEPEMTIDILREYRSLERHYLKTVDPLNSHLVKQRERLNIENFREEQQKRGFVWEELAKLRLLQKQRQKENNLKEERLRKKLFVEQWRNKQKSKIQQATKKIAKFYRIIPQFQLLSVASQQKSNYQGQDLRIALQNNEQKSTNQEQKNEQPNEQTTTLFYNHTDSNNYFNASKNKIVPLENINFNGLALSNQASQNISEKDQRLVPFYPQQNQQRSQVTLMGFQTNYFATLQRPLQLIGQQAKNQQQQNSSNSSQQLLLIDDEEDQFWKELEGQKNLPANKENQKDSSSKFSHKESDKQYISSTSNQANIQDKQNNNVKTKSINAIFAQQSDEQLQQDVILNKQQQDSAVKSVQNKTDSTQSRESALDHSSPKKFSILNLKSQKKQNSHFVKQKTEKPEANFKKFSISSQGTIVLESHNSIIELQEQELNKQNSDTPLKLNSVSTEGDDIQFTSRINNVKSHINPNHYVTSPLHQNLIHLNSLSNNSQKEQLQKQETENMNDSLLNDSDFYQNPEKKQEQTENYEYLAQVLKNLNEKIANKLKNESDEDNNQEDDDGNYDFEDKDENQDDDFNLSRKNNVRGDTQKNSKQTFIKKPDYSPVDIRDQNLEYKIRKRSDQHNFNKIIHEVEEEEDDEQRTNKNTERVNNYYQEDEQRSPSNQQSSLKQKNVYQENGETQLNESQNQHQENNKDEPISDKNQNNNHKNQNKPAFEISEYQKQRELLQIEWLKKIEQIRQEHKLIGANSSLQFFQLELIEKRKKEKEEQELKERMIKEVKYWKLMVDYKHEDDFTSKEDVMEQTVNRQLKDKEEEEQQRLRQLKYRILHKLKVVKKKKKLTKRQKKKQNLSKSIQNGNKASNDNSVKENSPNHNSSQMKSKERILKLKKLQQMIFNAGMSKKSGQNQNSIFQADNSAIRRKNDSNTVKDFKDNKSVITFSKFAGFQSPQNSVKGGNIKGKASQAAIQRLNKSFNSINTIGSVQDDVHRLKIPIKMSNRVLYFDQLSSHQGDDLSISEVQSVSVSNQNNSQSNSLTVRNTKFIISQTKKKRERIKKELLQDQNVKNNEKINYSNYNQVIHAINAPIKKSKDEQNDIQDNFDFKNEYLNQLREDALTGVKTKQIFSGIDVLRGYRGGALRLNNILRPLNSDRQEIKMWIPGILGILIVIHKHINHFVKSSFFNNLATLAVFANTVVLALEGSFTDDYSNQILDQLNNFFTFVFIGEMAFKVIGLTPAGYVRDRMNIFDGFIVCLSILELVIFSGSGSKAFSAFRSVRIFRTFRVLRVTRLLRGLEFMGVIIKVISRTLDSFIYIAFLLFLFIFIFTLLGMQIYGGKLQAIDPRVRQNFDTFQNGFITVFQLMTIENWNDILYKTFNSSVNKFLTSIYFIIWIFIGNWIFLNLFLAILLDGFTDQSQEDSFEQEDEDQYEEEVVDKNQNKHQQFNQLNQENLQILNEDFDRMDSEEMELLEQEILQLEGKSQNKQLFIGIECSHSLYLFSKQNSIRILFYKIVKHPQFENLILFFIVTSSLKLVVDTYVEESSALKNIDLMFNFIFITEALLKIIAYGFIGDNNSYLDESWSQIDFFIVCTSIVDMAFTGVNISFVKILRLLRTLRPLRFISHNVNMKVVVIALFESISGIFNILIVIFLIWIMFAILGISLIGNRMGYCSELAYIYHVNQDRCLSMGYSWKTYDTNFDNILNSMRTLYIISSLEGWPDLLYQAIDSNTADVGPVKDNYIQISYFYMIFILVGSFFLINLFVGVIFLNFNEAQKNERQSSLFLTEEQKRWIEFQQMIIGVKAEFSQSVVPTQKLPRITYNIITNQKFEIFIMILIVSNILTMAMAYEGSPSTYDSVLEYINLFFTSCFILEIIMKFIAFGIKGFFANDWNKFDLFVVFSSIIDIILNYSGVLSASFLRIGPQLIRIIRVFRVSRLLKLVKNMKGLQKLIETLMFSLPSLINVGALLLLVFFIYSILGVFMFKDVKQGVVIDKYNNFENFGNAMITLFRCSTGENWYQFMFDCGKTSDCVEGKDCGSPFSTLFFISFVLICSFIMLNLFILIIIQYFEDYHMKEDNPLQAFNDKLNIFRLAWSKYTKKTLGEKINSKDIVDFLYELPLPLGYHDSDPNAATAHPVTKKEIAKQVMNWALVQQVGDDQQEYVFFNDMLFACMKKEYGQKLMQNAGPELMKMLNKLEVETRLKIAEKKKKQILKKNKKVFGGYHQKGQKKANPMIAFMFLQMSFKAWSNYSKVKIANGKANGEQEEKSNSSFSEESNSSEESISREEEQLNDNQENQSQEEAQSNKQDIKDQDIEKQSIQTANRKKSEVVLRDHKLSRKGTYISKANSQNKYDLKNDLNKKKPQQSSSQSSSSSSSQSSNSDSNSSDDDSSSSSSQSRPNSKEKKRNTLSKIFDKQVSKKGNKSIVFDKISEKADKEEWSPNQKRNQSNKILRRIDTLNLQKLDTDFEFGQTNKYQYSANQNQNKQANFNKVQTSKQGNTKTQNFLNHRGFQYFGTYNTILIVSTIVSLFYFQQINLGRIEDFAENLYKDQISNSKILNTVVVQQINGQVQKIAWHLNMITQLQQKQLLNQVQKNKNFTAAVLHSTIQESQEKQQLINILRRNPRLISSWTQPNYNQLWQLNETSLQQIVQASRIEFMWKSIKFVDNKQLFRWMQFQSMLFGFSSDGILYDMGTNDTFKGYVAPPGCPYNVQPFLFDTRCRFYYQSTSKNISITVFPSSINFNQVSYFAAKICQRIKKYFSQDPNSESSVYGYLCSTLNLKLISSYFANFSENSIYQRLLDPRQLSLVFDSNLQINKITQIQDIETKYLQDQEQSYIFVAQLYAHSNFVLQETDLINLSNPYQNSQSTFEQIRNGTECFFILNSVLIIDKIPKYETLKSVNPAKKYSIKNIFMFMDVLSKKNMQINAQNLQETIIFYNKIFLYTSWGQQVIHFKQFGNLRALGICYNNMGIIHLNSYRYQEALENFGNSLVYSKYELGAYTHEERQSMCLLLPLDLKASSCHNNLQQPSSYQKFKSILLNICVRQAPFFHFKLRSIKMTQSLVEFLSNIIAYIFQTYSISNSVFHHFLSNFQICINPSKLIQNQASK
ncbi:hypothetical protein ABPG72_013735 [Tetrahymena utriculariae]